MVDLEEIREKHKKFCFKILHPNYQIYYLTKQECENAICNAKHIIQNMYTVDEIKQFTDNELLKEICTIDNKIPNMDHELYYL